MGRAPCCDKERVKRGPWAPEEDEQLRSYVRAHGIGGNWIALPQKAGLNRCGKSCRLRWLNYLRPDIRHGGYTDHEDRVICSLYASIGSRWSIIASKLPGRTDNDVKNYWNTKLKKKAMRQQYHGGDANQGAFSAPGSTALSSWSQAQCTPPHSSISPSASASSSVDTSSSSGDMCFPAAAAAMYQPPQQPMQRMVRLDTPPPPHTELAPVPTAATATMLDDAFLADLGAYGDLLFGGLMQDDKAAVAGLELSAAACYFPNMAEMMWAADHAHAKPPQLGALCNTFT
ncbi:hypothetical protein QYE76_015658 [Lolium multiflorum]|uniref:Uncharacterized protein n=1 Tax=Lolium multiflorum TaxID=4521 RepID=A0AAD8U2W8_LOLMU|nr:hypothetical protein QYE76_015658 [Lolium multiflorum]